MSQQHILIRLPNWLGDMVMATAFVKAVKEQFPQAHIDLIAKKGIDTLLQFFPAHNQSFIFSKDEYNGLTGAWKFGKKIASQKKYDIFFCLPDSISSAVMGYAIGAAKRVGYKKELRSVLLTQSFQKKKNIHRVEEYIDLLQQYLQTSITIPSIELTPPFTQKQNAFLININSEAQSRRLPKEKAVSIINHIRKNIPEVIFLIGSNKESAFVEEVYQALDNKSDVFNFAGNTDLPGLITFMSASKKMLTTDSGPAHLANALGVHTIVLFGAGNENNTAPYNKQNCTIIRLGQLSCEPCLSNTCKKFAQPECLLRLDEHIILSKIV